LPGVDAELVELHYLIVDAAYGKRSQFAFRILSVCDWVSVSWR
jgi:hypothetical protein